MYASSCGICVEYAFDFMIILQIIYILNHLVCIIIYVSLKSVFFVAYILEASLFNCFWK